MGASGAVCPSSVCALKKARTLKVFAYWVILATFLPSADLDQISTFEKKNTIRVSNSWDPDQTDNLSGLIWFQTVCKGYQQTTLVDKKFRQIDAIQAGATTDANFISIIYLCTCRAKYGIL